MDVNDLSVDNKKEKDNIINELIELKNTYRDMQVYHTAQYNNYYNKEQLISKNKWIYVII